MTNKMKSVNPSRKARTKQGIFQTNESKKFTGTKCIYRSSWELVVCMWCEKSDAVAKWDSEPFAIKYINEKGKESNYYVDFIIEMVNGEIWLIEVKPYSQTVPSASQAYQKNARKWSAAQEYCKEKGWKFTIMTEKHPLIAPLIRK